MTKRRVDVTDELAAAGAARPDDALTKYPNYNEPNPLGAVFHPLSPSLAGVRIGIAPRFRACGRESEQKRIR